jgi:hypothetical protein
MDRAGSYVVVGRAQDCDVVIDDGSVSARHACLRWDDDRIEIEDLGSANGTFVDGRMVARARVRPGDEVVLGRVALAWSEEHMRAFLRAGPRRTTVRSDTLRGRPIWGRRFVCGACHTRGLLPAGFDRGELTCSSCGAHLVLGDDRSSSPRRWGVALMGTGALLAGALAVFAIALSPPRAHRAWERVGRALGLTTAVPPPAASSPEEASIRARIAPRISASIDPTHPRTRNLAVRIAADDDGPFHVEQVARVWSHVRQSWHYVSDPRGGEYFAQASETIENGMAGDCDDFATVIIAMVESIGGQGRMVMVDGDDGGHAYAEVCIAAPPAEVAERLAAFYRSERAPQQVEVGDIHYRSDAACPVWLNLDWNARVPGGSYGRERWAVAIEPDGRTQTLAPALGDAPIAITPRLVRASAAPEP